MGNFNLACELLRDITQDVREAAYQRGYNKGFEDGERYTCKVDNSPSDEDSGIMWTDALREKEKSAQETLNQMQKDMEQFFGELTRLQGNLCQVESRVERIKNELQ